MTPIEAGGNHQRAWAKIAKSAEEFLLDRCGCRYCDECMDGHFHVE